MTENNYENWLLRSVKLHKNFSGLAAINDLNLNVKKGTIHGLIGPNGSGKTTFINLVSGVLPVTSGEIFLESQDIKKLDPWVLSKHGISRTFQAGMIDPEITTLENVMTGFYVRTKKYINKKV